MAEIRLTNAHGEFTTGAAALSIVAERMLPATADQLREAFCNHTDDLPRLYDDVITAPEWLIMIASEVPLNAL